MRPFVIAGLAAVFVAALPAPESWAQSRAIDDPDWMFEVLERVRDNYNLPAISASVVIGDRVVAASAAGRRKVDDPTPIDRRDRFKIGSVSKPVTATLIGALVEAKVMSFDDALEDMFPELKDTMQPDYRKVTVAQLLSHTSGMPYQPGKDESHERFKDLKDAVKNRYEYVKNALADRPVATPGTKCVYGGGQIIAAHYAEQLTKKPVEELYEEYVYKRLGWSGADHVNVTSGPDKLDGAWPHILREGKVVAAEPLGEHGKSRLPVGGVCRSMIDLGRLAADHLTVARGRDGLVLKAETYRKLHELRPPGESTMSWGRSGVDWAKGPCLWHSGATGDWFCLVHILPDEDFATCVATNYGGASCDQACQAAHLELVKRVPRLKQRLATERTNPGGAGKAVKPSRASRRGRGIRRGRRPASPGRATVVRPSGRAAHVSAMVWLLRRSYPVVVMR